MLAENSSNSQVPAGTQEKCSSKRRLRHGCSLASIILRCDPRAPGERFVSVEREQEQQPRDGVV